MEIYKYPKYYDIVYNYRDLKKEADFIESIFKEYSDNKISSVLDIACGTCSHSIELSKRGYKTSGLDLSEDMLKYAERKFKKEKLKSKLYKKNMRNFTLDENFDSAICMCASLHYLLTNEDYYSHLASMGNVVRAGGLYVAELDNPRQWFIRDVRKESLFNTWEIQKGNTKANIDLYKSQPNYIDGTYELKIIFNIKERQKEKNIISNHRHRILLPQEFKVIVDREGDFELVNYFGGFDMKQELDDTEKSWKMIAVLRRR